MPQPTLNEIKEAVECARELFHQEGVIEIDDAPETLAEAMQMVSACDDWKGEGGMYVKAWVWVAL